MKRLHVATLADASQRAVSPAIVAGYLLGYVALDGYERIFSTVFDQINAFAEGKPFNMINPDALKNRG